MIQPGGLEKARSSDDVGETACFRQQRSQGRIPLELLIKHSPHLIYYLTEPLVKPVLHFFFFGERLTGLQSFGPQGSIRTWPFTIR